MASPRRPLFSRLLRPASLVALCCWWGWGVATVCSQDRLVLKDNSVQSGKVSKMDNGAIIFSVPTGQLTFPLNLVGRVEAAAPATYATGLAAYQQGNWDKALADLKPIADTFKGLPTDWARLALGAVGDAYLEKGDGAGAELAFNDLQRWYPAGAGSALDISVARARLAWLKNDGSQARKLVDPIAQAALKAPAEVTRLDGAAYGQAFFVRAQIEQKGSDPKLQDALQDYLRVVTLFYQDAPLTARAQKAADDLRAAHPDLHSP